MKNKSYLAPSIQTITVSSCRYYLDGRSDKNRIIDTHKRYNEMAEWLYNREYDKRYKDIPFGKSTQAVKDRYADLYLGERITDYYVASLQNRVNGQMRSQRELLKLYKEQNDIAIAETEDKVKSVEDTLKIHKDIKEYLIARSKSITKETPAPDNAIPEKYSFYIDGNKIHFCSDDKHTVIDLYRYECSLDSKIRAEKARIATIGEKLKRLQAKQFDMPRRMTFGGGRTFYKTKDTLKLKGGELRQWHNKRDDARTRVVNFSGRHTSQYGNFQCRYDVLNSQISITLMDGSVSVFENVEFPYCGEELKEYVLNRMGSVGYTMEYRRDGENREYVVIKASITVENPRANTSMETGCVAFDTNADCLAWCDIDEHGNKAGGGVIPFDVENMPTDQRFQTLAKAVNQLVGIAKTKRKPLAMEDLDFFRKKSAMA
jgi:hypothetical protein